jgi:hypothetical protein
MEGFIVYGEKIQQQLQDQAYQTLHLSVLCNGKAATATEMLHLNHLPALGGSHMHIMVLQS